MQFGGVHILQRYGMNVASRLHVDCTSIAGTHASTSIVINYKEYSLHAWTGVDTDALLQHARAQMRSGGSSCSLGMPAAATCSHALGL